MGQFSGSALVLAAACGLAGATTSYHIGNSFTWDSSPNAIPDLAAAAGHAEEHAVGYHIRCNSSLATIVANPTSTCVEPVDPYGLFGEALPNFSWTSVILQPFAELEITFAEEVAAAVDLIALAMSGPGEPRLFIMQSWAQRNDYAQTWTAPYHPAPGADLKRSRAFHDAFLAELRRTTGAEISMIPTGEVLFQLDQRIRAGHLPGVSSLAEFFRDPIHMSYAIGRYTAAITVYSVLFAEDPTGLYVDGGSGSSVPEDLRLAIGDAVWDVVRLSPDTGLSMDVTDLLEYLGNFRQGDPAADLDGDGVPAVNDLLLFLGAFRAHAAN